MIKASELRIGNYCSGDMIPLDEKFPPSGYRQQNFQITAEDIVAIERRRLDFKPIPLTEEWLRPFGFEAMVKMDNKDPITAFMKKNTLIYIDKDWTTHIATLTPAVGEKGQMYYQSSAIGSFKNYSVHQLQNLYFALTGEELIIKS